MGNSCNKVAPLGCCSSPVICTAHISCSVPIWCGSPSCCSDPKVQPVVEPEPRAPPGPASPGDPGQQSTQGLPTNPASVEAAASVTPDGNTSSVVGAANDAATYRSSANGLSGAVSPRPGTEGAQAAAAVDWPVAASEADGLEAGEPVAAEAETPGATRRELHPDDDEEPVDEDKEPLPPYNFNPEGLTALENFGLAESCGTLVDHSAGRPAVQTIQTMCLYASNAGAATWNCKRLLGQIQRVCEFLDRALQKGGLRRLVRKALTELQPLLARGEGVFASWEHKGSVEKFFSGRAADDEFVALHQDLRECCKTSPFAKLLAVIPAVPQHPQPLQPSDTEATIQAESSQSSPHTAEATAPGSAPLVEEPSGYGSVEASRVAFERLLMLFLLRYKPSKRRTQKQRLLDLLHWYNDSWTSVEDKIEHLVKMRLDKTATGALPLLKAMMMNMWGATEVPRVRVEKWRMAVRLALEPLMVVTGEWQLPLTPDEGLEDFVED